MPRGSTRLQCMRCDCDAVDNVEYDDEEDEDVDLLDLELVNCYINIEGN